MIMMILVSCTAACRDYSREGGLVGEREARRRNWVMSKEEKS